MSSYANDRLRAIGFDPQKDFGLLDVYSGDAAGLKKPKPRMWSDEEGNLCIGLVHLDNVFIVAAPETTGKESREILHVKRLANPEPDSGKYRPGRIGQGVYPIYWPYTLKCFREKTKIKTLVLTEGYLKAYQLDKSEILTIGLPGITVWKEKNQEDIFSGIRQIAAACECENIIWITDADTTTVEWKESKDLSKRPWSFFTSIRMFKELTYDLGINQFWYHIQENSLHKGIDDLILADPESILQIRKEIGRPGSTDGNIFKRFNVSATSYEKIKEYFGIDSGAEGFYKKYEEKIGLKPFVYGKGFYQWSDEKNKLEYIRAGESAQFIMIDSTYYIKGSMPTLHGNTEEVLKPTKINAIQKMFQHKSKAEVSKILYDIPHYHGFINRPSHTQFQPVYESQDADGYVLKFYNKYHRLSWNPKAGTIDLSLQFIKHVFGTGTVEYDGKPYNEFDLGLDYIQLLYLMPMQKLPILCLVSEEGSTGKTKFWEWMAKIFQQNVKEIASDQLTGQFTTYFASSLLVYIDEAFIDRHHVVEKLKQLVTSAKQRLEGKFENADVIDNFLKIGLSSNNVKNFANIRTEEMRFWIRELKQIPKDQYDPYFEEKLFLEIPAFLDFLAKREMVTSRISRLWFASELIETEALRSVKSESRSSIEITLEMVIRDYIMMCGKSIVNLSPKDLKLLMDEHNITLSKIRWGMQRYGLNVSPFSNQYEFYAETKNLNSDDSNYFIEHKKTATYKIPASIFMTPEECAQFFKQEELLRLEEYQQKSEIPTWFQLLNNRSCIKVESSENNSIEILQKVNSYKTFIELKDKLPF